MGQKTNPIANRLGIIIGWQSSWCGDYKVRIEEDYRIRKYIDARLSRAGVSRIYIERTLRFITITITTSRPALVIGKGGDEVDRLRNELKKITKKEVQVNILEIKRPDLDALLVAKNIARQIESRISYKKIIKQSITTAMRMNAYGIKIQVSGRLNNSEMARTEHYKDGSISLSTLRSDMDYALFEAHTTSGRIGIKVWIKKGEIYGLKDLSPLSGLQRRQRINHRSNNKFSSNIGKKQRINSIKNRKHEFKK